MALTEVLILFPPLYGRETETPSFCSIGGATFLAFVVAGVARGFAVSRREISPRFDFSTLATFFMCVASKKTMVSGGMFRLGSLYFEVLNPIVKFIAVFVVNYVRSEQRSAKMLLHDMTVFEESSPFDINTAIASCCYIAALVVGTEGNPPAMIRAKSLPSTLRWSSTRKIVMTALLTSLNFHVESYGFLMQESTRK